MTDRDGGQDGRQDDGVDIATAAARLGLSKEAVRKKIARGTLRAIKVAGLWRIILPAVPDAASPASEREQNAEHDAILDAYRVRLADKASEINLLRQQLQARDQQIERMKVLVQQEQQQVRQLTDQRQQQQPAPEPPRRRWWLWRR